MAARGPVEACFAALTPARLACCANGNAPSCRRFAGRYSASGTRGAREGYRNLLDHGTLDRMAAAVFPSAGSAGGAPCPTTSPPGRWSVCAD